MKLILILALVSITLCTNTVQDYNEAETYADGRQVMGLNYGMGSNGGYNVENPGLFKKARMVDHLFKTDYNYSSEPSLKESVDEVPSITNYYDGEVKLNVMKVNCKVYHNYNDCIHQAQCGWCHQGSKCIMGNSMGPLEDCPRAQYVFSNPFGALKEFRVNNHDVGGLSIQTISGDNMHRRP